MDDEGSSQGEPQSKSPQESRRLSIQRCIQFLVHACQCCNANCSLLSCWKLKRVVQHTKGCKRKTKGGCPVCKQLIALCCYHAKHCQENKCPVPFCLKIKHKLRQESQRLSFQSLVHACQCRSDNCSLPSCLKMKQAVQHTKGCKLKTNGACPICMQIIDLCCYHAKHCQENKCPAPLCLYTKHKLHQLHQQQIQHRLQQAQLMRRRMATMNTRNRA